MTLQVELVSPERVVVEAEADMVVARTLGGGDVAFMTGHAPFLGALATHTVSIYLSGGGREVAAVHGGFVSVVDDKVRILSNAAEVGSQIDAQRAERARAAAEESLRHGTDAEAEAALRRANIRLSVVQG
jgi:F-type H+-transporting ATPase subunit epsilon